VFIYKCKAGHEVKVFANAFRGKTPVPGVGAIMCPTCEFNAKFDAMMFQPTHELAC
jgi:hypothetical protein